MRRMAPRLRPNLLPHNCRKAAGPLVPRPRLHHVLDRRPIHQLWVQARIIEHRRQQYERAERRDGACVAEILVADDGFVDGFGLRRRGAERAEEVVCDHGACEFERDERGVHVPGRCADVVQHAEEEEGLRRVVEVGEVLGRDGLAWNER